MSSTTAGCDINGDRSDLPLKEIPGGYGVPFFSALKDRWDYYYSAGGNDGFFSDRVAKYGSTVFRTNMAPASFMASDPRVVVVLDAKSFPVLFDVSKVEKKDVLTGTYVPPWSLTGGYRCCAYLDPSEPSHAMVKQMVFSLVASRKDRVIPEFHDSFFTPMFNKAELQLADTNSKKPATADFNKLNDTQAFEFFGKAYFGIAPSEYGSKGDLAGDKGGEKATKWLFFQLHPLISGTGIPKLIEDLFLHTFPLPPFLVKSDYRAMYDYFNSVAKDVIDDAERLGLSREEACHNILFVAIFNAYGGMKVLFPAILKYLVQAGKPLHDRLAKEIRAAIGPAGHVTLSALEEMELTKSVVYEALRMDPPVKFQYAKAKEDLVIESHDAAFKVKKGEMIFGYQPFATRDEKVFGSDAGKFVADRFIGEEGKKLLKYVFWSNGRETENPTLANKQCPGKDLVVLLGRLMVVELFLRYDTFTAEVGTILLGTQVNFTSFTTKEGNKIPS